MRRNLAVALIVCSLLWGAGGVAVLATAAHEHRHHSEAHDHGGALQVAMHGHSHQGEPEHDHECAAPPAGPHATRFSPAHEAPYHTAPDDRGAGLAGALFDTHTGCRDLGPLPYLAHCVLLT